MLAQDSDADNSNKSNEDLGMLCAAVTGGSDELGKAAVGSIESTTGCLVKYSLCIAFSAA